MPEAAVYKDHRSVLRKYDVGPAGKGFFMQPESVTHTMQDRAHRPLGLSILAANAAHVPAAMLFGESVRHVD